MKTKLPARAVVSYLALVLTAGAAIGAWAGPVTVSSLKDIAESGKVNSLDYARALNAEASAFDAIPAVLKFGSSSLSTSASYGQSPAGTFLLGGSVSANVPIIEQAGLSLSIDDSLSASLGATVNPLSHSASRTLALISYEKAQAASIEAGKAASINAIKAALTWMSQKRKLETLRKDVQVKKDAYEAAKASNALEPDVTTTDDLVSALRAWSSARSSLLRSEASERSALVSLYAAIGSSASEVSLEVLDLSTLEKELKAFESSLSGVMEGSPAQSYSLLVATLGVESEEASAAAIWAFEPDLSLGLNVGMPAGGSVTPSASLRFSLSLDSFRSDDKADAGASLTIARTALARQAASEEAAWGSAIAAVHAAAISVENAVLALEQAKEVAAIASFNLQSGTGSALEKRTAELSVDSASDDYYQAMVDAYLAWQDLAYRAGK